MNKKILCILGALIFIMGLLTTNVYAATTIEQVDMMITSPCHLGEPDTFLQIYTSTCQIDTTYNSEGYKNGLRWKALSTGRFMGPSDTFIGGEQYELSVCLLSKTGYAFSASKTVATINLDTASLSVQDVNRARATITFTADNLFINYVNVSGLDEPKVGNTLDYSLVLAENTCKSRIETWIDTTASDTMLNTAVFKSGHAYRFSFNLLAESGYEFPENVQVLVNGKSAAVITNVGKEISVAIDFPVLTTPVTEHTHTPSEWRTTQVYHYRVCTTCGEMLPAEDHKGGIATCVQKGKCTVCGYEYIEKNENHTPDTSKWTACGELYHSHLCKLCGAHVENEDHKPGAAATETQPQLCTACGYIIAPALGHTHSLTLVQGTAPTCVGPGVITYYTCSGCNIKFSDSEGKNAIIDNADLIISPNGHKIADGWKFNEDNHWRVCEVCKAKMLETEMKHELSDGKCTTCGFENTADASKKETALPLWLIITVGIAAVGVGFSVSFLIVSKSKKN